MLLVPKEEAAKRARAAIAYAGWGRDYKAVAKASGLSYDVVRRIVSPTNPRGTPIEDLWAIADACGVPRQFMEEGFTDGQTTEERLAALEELLEGLVQEGARRQQREHGSEGTDAANGG